MKGWELDWDLIASLTGINTGYARIYRHRDDKIWWCRDCEKTPRADASTCEHLERTWTGFHVWERGTDPKLEWYATIGLTPKGDELLRGRWGLLALRAKYFQELVRAERGIDIRTHLFNPDNGRLDKYLTGDEPC